MKVTFTLKSVNGVDTPKWSIDEIISALTFDYTCTSRMEGHHDAQHRYMKIKRALASSDIKIDYDFTYNQCLAEVTVDELYIIAKELGFFCSATKDLIWTKDNLYLFMERKASSNIGIIKTKIQKIGEEKLNVTQLDNSKM